MTLHHEDPWLTVWGGDCREVMAGMEPESVHCVVTSPPFWGLRDYGVAGQLGLEPTPEEFVANLVAVFREVARVLRSDGTVWLNLGDSYASSPPGNTTQGVSGASTLHGVNGSSGRYRETLEQSVQSKRNTIVGGLKPKDLVGIPWLVARALQEPYYTGRIRRERDRVWLAAMIDAEGTICGFDHDRADGGGHRSGVHLTITNSSVAILDEAARIWPTSRNEHGHPGPGHLGELPTWRWIVHGIENKQSTLRELYPYLIAKRQQAVVAYTLLDLMANAKRLGHSPQKDATIAKRAVLTGLLSDLNHQRPITPPSWLIEPPTLFEPGWYLRSDIIWAKPNPMPESVTDRPTKSHEYLFLLSKSPRYFFDADAVREGAGDERVRLGKRPISERQALMQEVGMHGKSDSLRDYSRTERNVRSVWTVATQPYAGSHFAVFPEKLVEPCILAGTSERGVCPECGAPWVRVVERQATTSYQKSWANGEHVQISKGLSRPGQFLDGSAVTTGWNPTCTHDADPIGAVVLDCFAGSGTVGRVANRLSRRAVLIDMNPDYLTQQMARNRDIPLGLGA